MFVFLKHLHILQFKNIAERSFDFSEKIAVLAGKNASGKTNVLDAVHYLAMTKSYFASTDMHSIMQGQEFFVLYGKFEHQNTTLEVSCSVNKNEGKQLFCNQKPYARLSQHIGKIPVVVVAPSDIGLITEYADTRRKFLDALISKYDPEYLQALIQYQQVLQQRNSIIRQGEAAYQQEDLLFVYHARMVQTADVILNKRKKFFEEIANVLSSTYQQLQDCSEILELKYVSTIQNDFAQELQHALAKDIRLGYTSVGIHRDDFDIMLNGHRAKIFASQGQQKTIVIALKWIELYYIYIKTKMSPILLLDDIYDSLDSGRLKKIGALLQSDMVGQIILTDTEKDRLQNLFETKNMQIIEM